MAQTASRTWLAQDWVEITEMMLGKVPWLNDATCDLQVESPELGGSRWLFLRQSLSF